MIKDLLYLVFFGANLINQVLFHNFLRVTWLPNYVCADFALKHDISYDSSGSPRRGPPPSRQKRTSALKVEPLLSLTLTITLSTLSIVQHLYKCNCRGHHQRNLDCLVSFNSVWPWMSPYFWVSIAWGRRLKLLCSSAHHAYLMAHIML